MDFMFAIVVEGQKIGAFGSFDECSQGSANVSLYTT